MVVELVLGVLATVVGFVVGLFPQMDPPGWLTTTLPGFIDSLASYIVGVNAWVPFDHVPAVLAFVASALGLAVAVKCVRIIASFLTAGGGSAA